MSNTKIQLTFQLKNILNSFYSNLPLRQKISLPFLSVFLIIWFVGNFGIVYYFSQNIEQRHLKEVEGIAGLVMQEFQRQMNKLYLNAKLLVGGTTIPTALEAGNKTEILQKIIPAKASLSLDIVKVIDKNGNNIIDLRNPTLNQVKISDRVVISQITNGVAFSSMITGKEFNNSRSILIGATPIKSNQGVIGGVIIGTAINNQLLDEISTETDKYIVAFQNKEIIASSLPGNDKFSWDEIHQKHDQKLNKIKIDDHLYIIKNISIFALDGTELELTVLSSLADLEEAKQKFVIIISLFSFLGAGIVLIVGYSLSNLIVSRIATVTSATEELAKGDLKMRLPVTYNDEVDKLAEGFNLMAQQLEERELKINLQVQKLEENLEELSINQVQLVQTDKMSSLGRIVGRIAHEIDNPISFIYSNIDYTLEYFNDLQKIINIYQQEYPEPTPLVNETLSEIDLEFLVEDLQQLFKSMKSDTNRIKNIVQSLRIFSQLDESEIKSVDINKNIDYVISILQQHFSLSEEIKNHSHKQINIVKNYGNLPPVICNSGKLNQVFFNIISNGIDSLNNSIAMEKKTKNPQILIMTEVTDNNSVKIKIADNGNGMTKEVRKKIFDPFFTTKPIGSGTGLGLFISYLIIVDDHQGKLSCISTPEVGTEFLIEIPIA